MTNSFVSYVDLKKEAMKDLDPSVELTAAATQMDQNLGLFLEEAEQVKKEMGSFRIILTRLYEANKESKSLHKPDALKSLRNRINADLVAVQKKSKFIRSQLEDMDRANTASRGASRCRDGTPIDWTQKLSVSLAILHRE